MKRLTQLTLVLAPAAATLAIGYWLGSTQLSISAVDTGERTSMKERTRGEARGEIRQVKGKILYYRNPMGLPDISPTPKKDPMGMDYIPVYEGEETSAADGLIKISSEKIQRLGVKTEAVTVRELARIVRAVATVQPDERRLHVVAPKFEGWIQRLHVNATGQAVKKGDPLMEVYSPELITAQHEYLVALKGAQMVEGGGVEARAGMRRLAESALQRLRNWDISESDVRLLLEEGQFKQAVTFRAPAGGVVLEKSAIEGQRFEPGDALYRIANLSTVWVMADVFEQDIALIQRGAAANIRMDAYPDKEFTGEVLFIYPTINAETRTAKVRVELPNRDGLLKPAMYGRADIISPRAKLEILAVPKSAILDSGIRQWVLVDLGEGRFQPREIKPGMRTDNYTEVVDGLIAGEMVVVKANFLIDAESNLKAALSAFDHGGHGEQISEPGGAGDKQEIRQGSAGAIPDAPPVSHIGEGTVEAVDLTQETVTLAHGPIPSLSWPAMTMDFHVSDAVLIRTLKPGQKITFEITEEPGKGYVISSIKAMEPHAPANPAARDRKAHRDGR